MSSVETEKGPAPPTVETEKGPAPPTEAPPAAANIGKQWVLIDVILRVLLLAATIVAVVVMVTSKQTEMILATGGPRLNSARFQDSPAFIYFVAALSVAGLYSIITAIASLSFLAKPNTPPKIFWILLAHDVIILGIVASATGTAGGVAYIGLKGNTHVNWMKICSTYDKFCRYIGSSLAVSLFAAVVLVVLIILDGHSLYRHIPGN